jgi:hypothetical protein
MRQPTDPARAANADVARPTDPGEAWQRHTRIRELIETIRSMRRTRTAAPQAPRPTPDRA